MVGPVNGKSREVVHMDESNIHRNCCSQDNRLFDLIDIKFRYKSNSYCFISASLVQIRVLMRYQKVDHCTHTKLSNVKYF